MVGPSDPPRGQHEQRDRGIGRRRSDWAGQQQTGRAEPGAGDYLRRRRSSAWPPHPRAGSETDRRRRRKRQPAVSRFLHRQHPQPEHPRRLRRRLRAFFAWLDAKQVAPLAAVRTHHVSAYVEVLGRRYRAPTVKQHLAAIRMLFDWLIVGQIFAGPNPAAAVRGPKHVVKKGKTSVLDGDEAKKLLDLIDVSTTVGLRDRALIALLGLHLRARLGGAAHERRRLLSARQTLVVAAARKGGKQHEMPAHHLLESYIDAYLTAAGIGADKASPLFRTLGGRAASSSPKRGWRGRMRGE